MRLLSAVLIGLVLLPSINGAGDPKTTPKGDPKTSQGVDLWDAAYIEGNRAGFVRTTIVENAVDGKKILSVTVDLNLTLKRFNETIQIRAQTGNDETPDGKVTSVFLRQFLAQKQQVHIKGTVEGNRLKRVIDDVKPIDSTEWDNEVVGLVRQQRLFQEKRVKPGDKFTYLSYEPTVSLVVKNHVEVKGYEDVELPGKGKQKLLRVEAKPEKIENVALPPLTVWLDDALQTAKQRVEVPGLGELTLYRTSKDGATGAGPVIAKTDIGISQLLSINYRFPKPYETKRVVYRIRIKGDDDPGSAFARDDRQKVHGMKDDTIEMSVTAERGPKEKGGKGAVGDEFIKSSYFINCDDAKVKELAQKAVGAETDPWKKALKMEKWVNSAMTSRNYEALATADHVARTLEGDCTEYAMLFAAMCRAEGIPSRTALGLIYAESKQGPVLAFHMWTEVWVQGQWVPLDATLGRGYVGATHLKITDHSWHETRTMTPLLPVVRVLGKMSIEVLSAE